ncbi:nuclear pore complex protein subunit [Blumeria hordei DH14]|uniref:Nuclear pore complex protein subunit n=1 Tax=Blumeria graminis f. sp. hordei (strain DH14) TaxID=546991 RepID=N1JEK5_BLUG1|nr:nuclear pore complex protein subunit [Blumeria hordei DH14]
MSIAPELNNDNAKIGPEIVDIQTEGLGFLALSGESKVQLLPTPWPPQKLPPPNASLLATATKRGLVAAVGPDSLILATTKSVRDAYDGTGPSTVKLKKFEPQIRVLMETRISQLVFTSDETYLVLSAETGGGLAVYDVQSLLDGSQQALFELPTNGEALRCIVPNPSPEKGELIALVTAGGDLMIANLKGREYVSSPQGSVFKKCVSCVSWSTKGKQLVAGLGDGTAFQMTPEGEAKAEIPRPPGIDLIDHGKSNLICSTVKWLIKKVSSILWLENHMFIIIHTPSQFGASSATSSKFHLVTRTQNLQNYTFQKISDPAQPFGLNRNPPHHFILRLRDFPPNIQDIVIVASTASTDIGLLTRCKTPLTNEKPATEIAGVFTMTEMCDDARRAQLPLSAELSDTSPIGVSLDLSSKEMVLKPIPGDEIDESFTPLPALMVLNNEGVLASWWIVYSDSIRNRTVYPGLDCAKLDPRTPHKSIESSSSPSFVLPTVNSVSCFPSTNQPGGQFGSPTALGQSKSPWMTSSAANSFDGNKPSFGLPTIGSSFTSTQIPAFGKPAFGAPSFGTPAFGATSESSTAPNSTSTQAPAFGKPAFGAPSFGTPAFGATSESSTAPNSTSTQAPAFGKAAFGAPSFGTPAFGATSESSTALNSTSTQAPAFGKPAFGAPSFGTPAFGATSESSTALNSTSTQAPAFGKPAFGAPSFGTPAFGATSESSTALNSTSTQAPAFGKPAFGAPSFGTPAFGTFPMTGSGIKTSIWASSETKNHFMVPSNTTDHKMNPPTAQLTSKISSFGSSPTSCFLPNESKTNPLGNGVDTANNQLKTQEPNLSHFGQLKNPTNMELTSQSSLEGFVLGTTFKADPASKDDLDRTLSSNSTDLFGNDFRDCLTSSVDNKAEVAAGSRESPGIADQIIGEKSKEPGAEPMTPSAIRKTVRSQSTVFDENPQTTVYSTPLSKSIRSPEIGVTSSKKNELSNICLESNNSDSQSLDQKDQAQGTYLDGTKSRKFLKDQNEECPNLDHKDFNFNSPPQPSRKSRTQDDLTESLSTEAPLPPDFVIKNAKSSTLMRSPQRTLAEHKSPVTNAYSSSNYPKNCADVNDKTGVINQDHDQMSLPITPKTKVERLDAGSNSKANTLTPKASRKKLDSGFNSPNNLLTRPEEEDFFEFSSNDDEDDPDDGDTDDEGSQDESGDYFETDLSPSPDMNQTDGLSLESSYGIIKNISTESDTEVKLLFGEIELHPSATQTSPRSPSLGQKPDIARRLRSNTSRSVSAPGAAPGLVDPRKQARRSLCQRQIPSYSLSLEEQQAEEKRRNEERAQKEAEDKQALIDQDDIIMQNFLASRLEPTTQLCEFIAHSDYVSTSSMDNIPAQVETVYRDINSMIDTLGLNIRSMKEFVLGHSVGFERRYTREDMKDESNWVISKIHDLSFIIDRVLAQELENGRLKNVSEKAETLSELQKDLARLRMKQSEIKRSVTTHLDPEQLALARIQPLGAKSAAQQYNLRKNFTNFQKLLAQSEEELAVLRAKMVAKGSRSQDGSSAGPTVEAIMRTINKMTNMAEKRSVDVDVLEGQIRRLQLDSPIRTRSRNSLLTYMNLTESQQVPGVFTSHETSHTPKFMEGSPFRNSLISSFISVNEVSQPHRRLNSFTPEEKAEIRLKLCRRKEVASKLRQSLRNVGLNVRSLDFGK